MPIYNLPNASFSVVSRIDCLKFDNVPNKLLSIGNATGFFFDHAEGLYLITNRHVISGNDYFPETVALTLHTDQQDLAQNENYLVNLYEDGEPKWLVHPVNIDIDLVAIPLDYDDITDRFLISSYNNESIFPSNMVLSYGEDLIVMGYPLGLYDEEHNLPIFRNATLASIHPIPFENEPCFLIDSRLHEGTSGSPVVTKPCIPRRINNEWALQDQDMPLLVGVNSGIINKKDSESGDLLGLNVVWFASLIPEIIEGNRLGQNI